MEKLKSLEECVTYDQLNFFQRLRLAFWQFTSESRRKEISRLWEEGMTARAIYENVK